MIDNTYKDSRDGGRGGFKRHFFLPGVVLTAAEIAFVVLPLWQLFDLSAIDRTVLIRVCVPVLVGASVMWLSPMAAWLAPVQQASNLRRKGKRIPTDLRERAFRATLRVPLRALLLRTAVWVLAATAIGGYLVEYAEWRGNQVAEIASITALHAFCINVVRAVWYATILAGVRARVFPRRPSDALERFAHGYFGHLILVALVVWGGTLAGVASFLYYFLPISLGQYLQIWTYFPTAVAIGALGWVLLARWLVRHFDAYLDGDGVARETGAQTATQLYRRAQALPYRLAATSIGVWVAIIAIAAWVARYRLQFEVDDTVLMVGIALVIAIGTAIYETLWYRETMRPLLAHLTVRYRLPVRGIRPALSLRTKLLLSFGGVVFFACGLALFWGFIQYKNLVTDFTYKQSELSLRWLRSEIAAAAAANSVAPTPDLVREALQGIDARSPEANAVYYYLPDDEPDPKVMAVGGGLMGAPKLPWYTLGQLRLPYDDDIEIEAASMAGRHGRLLVSWDDQVYDLGGVAVFYPNYRGRGESVVRPLKELLIFFFVLFGASAGIVLITVGQFVKPIRMLEQRADGMARGELADPVSSGGEGDEIGRLTFALEEMRRALREKLRSTEEVNLDLERAVQRRTADLAKKNRELAETLDKLTRAQDQLVRAEKMASIGQLVAGIAHEINNPVNAIVNTVGPLEAAIGEAIDDPDAEVRNEAAADVREMVRVVQRGAQRTKAIVQALHNYSRTDDESVVEFDLNRSIDDSLELLRHMLKGNITVERHYGEVGRVRGHAGQLNQVFMNLLTNAAQAVAGRDDATIRIETAAGEGDEVVIKIADNGRGIPPEVLPRIFDPFFTTKDVGEGTGLGLSIVHGLVERHGGRIEVDSEPGVGTTFTVWLPRGPLTLVAASRASLSD